MSGRGSFKQDIIRNGHLRYIQIPSRTIWSVILENVTHSLRSIDRCFDIDSQPQAHSRRVLGQIALFRASVSSSSKHDGQARWLPIRIWENIETPQVPPNTQRLGSYSGRSSTTIPSHNPSTDYGANLANNSRRPPPRRIDGTFDDPDQALSSTDLFTGANSSIIVKETLSAKFCNHLIQSIHNPYRCRRGFYIPRLKRGMHGVLGSTAK